MPDIPATQAPIVHQTKVNLANLILEVKGGMARKGLNARLGFDLRKDTSHYVSCQADAPMYTFRAPLLFFSEDLVRRMFRMQRESSVTEGLIKHLNQCLGQEGSVVPRPTLGTVDVIWTAKLDVPGQHCTDTLQVTIRYQSGTSDKRLLLFKVTVDSDFHDTKDTPQSKAPRAPRKPREKKANPFPRDIPELEFTATRFQQVRRFFLKNPSALSAKQQFLLNNLVWADGGLKSQAGVTEDLPVTQDMVGKTLKQLRAQWSYANLTDEEKLSVLRIYDKWVYLVVRKDTQAAVVAWNKHKAQLREAVALMNKAQKFIDTSAAKKATLEREAGVQTALHASMVSALNKAMATLEASSNKEVQK